MKKQPTHARFWVLEYGQDCDGMPTRGRIAPFFNEEEAEQYAQECAHGSDGMTYSVESIAEARRYCEEHGKEFINYAFL